MSKTEKFFFNGGLISALIMLFLIPAISQEKPALLKEITASIETYRGKNVEMKLRLKYRDHIFGRIVFYDSENADIEFDISSNIEKKRLASELVNLHEGMEYTVKFKVKEIGALGAILAEVESFKPVILKLIPEAGPKNEKAE